MYLTSDAILFLKDTRDCERCSSWYLLNLLCPDDTVVNITGGVVAPENINLEQVSLGMKRSILLWVGVQDSKFSLY